MSFFKNTFEKAVHDLAKLPNAGIGFVNKSIDQAGGIMSHIAGAVGTSGGVAVGNFLNAGVIKPAGQAIKQASQEMKNLSPVVGVGIAGSTIALGSAGVLALILALKYL